MTSWAYASSVSQANWGYKVLPYPSGCSRERTEGSGMPRTSAFTVIYIIYIIELIGLLQQQAKRGLLCHTLYLLPLCHFRPLESRTKSASSRIFTCVVSTISYRRLRPHCLHPSSKLLLPRHRAPSHPVPHCNSPSRCTYSTSPTPPLNPNDLFTIPAYRTLPLPLSSCLTTCPFLRARKSDPWAKFCDRALPQLGARKRRSPRRALPWPVCLV